MYYWVDYHDIYDEGISFCRFFDKIDINKTQDVWSVVETELKKGKSLAAVRINKKRNEVELVEYYNKYEIGTTGCISSLVPLLDDLNVVFVKYYSSGQYIEESITERSAVDFYLGFGENPPLNSEAERSLRFEYEYYISSKRIDNEACECAELFLVGMCMRVGCRLRF